MVAWGDGWFTSEAPAKKILQAVADIVPAALTPEQKHPRNAMRLQNLVKTPGSRILKCVNANSPLKKVDRDTNGAANIGTCCVHTWIEENRPTQLEFGPPHN